MQVLSPFRWTGFVAAIANVWWLSAISQVPAAGTARANALDSPPPWIIGWGIASDGPATPPPEGTFVALATGQNHSLALTPHGSAVAWGGSNSYGQTTVPADLSGVIAVATGGDGWHEDSAYSLALKADGTVTAWGYDQEQIAVPAGLDQVVAIAAGRTHCLALKRDGTVVAWGSIPLDTGVAPPPGLHDVVAIAAGGFSSLALKSDGSVVAWGRTFNGTDWEDASTPVGLTDVVAIAAGRFHSLALKNDGTVVAWGYNLNGQTQVPADLSGVVAVAAGGFHSLALQTDGSVVAWGLNNNGQTDVPIAAQGGVTSISAGLQYSLALRPDAGVAAITSPSRLVAHPGVAISYPIELANPGDAAPVFSAMGLPAGLSIDPLSGLISGTVTTATRGSIRVQVATSQGILTQMVWIGIADGQAPTAVVLTAPGVLENSAPGVVVGTLSAVDPDAGDSHTFEWVDGPGDQDNWRFRIEGNQLRLAQPITRDFEQNPAGFSIRVRARDASLNPYEQILTIPLLDDRTEDADGDGLTEAAEEDVYHTSDLLYDTDGDGFGDGFEVERGFQPDDPNRFPVGAIVLAWGGNDDGQTSLPAGLDEVMDLAAGGNHNLALKSDGSVVAWGDDRNGQSTLPADLPPSVAVAAGVLHSVALTRTGLVVAWGNNDGGQTAVPKTLANVVAITAGGYHSLALRCDGTVEAWGYDAYGQATVPAGLGNVVAIAAGGFHSLAVKSDGTVVAWGSAWGGATAVPEGLTGVIAVAAGAYHSLALKNDGTVVAWGYNHRGQAQIPPGLGPVTAIAAGWAHSLALFADGTMVAWGDSTGRQTATPHEALHLHQLVGGESHNLALRQDSGWASFTENSSVRSWPGETLARPTRIQNAIPLHFSAMGLPADLAIDPASGLISGTVQTGERCAVRIMVETDHGPLTQVIWFDTADGVAPTEIRLSSTTLAENSPAETVVGTISVTDPNAGDSCTLELPESSAAPDNPRFRVADNHLIVRDRLSADYDAGTTRLWIRVLARDSHNNTLEQEFVLQLTDDRTEDADGDGINEAIEEDLMATGDAHFDDFNTANPDRDGVPSMLEYAFNLDPHFPGLPVQLIPGAGSTAGLPAIQLVTDGAGKRRLRMEYLRRVGGPLPLTYTPEFASHLNPADWLPATHPVTVTPINAEWERCIVEDALSTTEATCRFGRVAISW